MGSLLVQLIPAALVGAASALPITIVITLLLSRRGLAKALAFGIALVSTFAAAGAVALATASTNARATPKGSAITGTIIAVLGGLLLLMAIKQLLQAPDPDAPPPKLMSKLDSMSPGGAALLGLIIAVINFKQIGVYLAGVSQIVNADVSTAQGWLALILLLLVVQIGVIGAILAYLLARTWATRILTRFRSWLVKHNRVISIVLGLGVGVWFLAKGITQIAG